MQKTIALILVLMIVLLPAAMAEAAVYQVGICQLAQHEALDAATLGFMASLREKLGDTVSFNLQNASGDLSTCVSIVNGFIADDVDLILANSTQALQAAYASTGEIPILGVSVSDYAAALDMDVWTGVTGVNVSGVSDLAPLSDQAELIRELYPDAEKIGLLYCSSEANSEYQAAIITGYLTSMGYQCAAYTFADSNDVFSVAQSACADSDVIFVPTDNTVATCVQVIRNAIEITNTPVIGGDEAICAGTGVATLAVDYYDLGALAGDMAYDVLVNGKDVATTPIRMVPSFICKYNPEICAMLGVEAPENASPIE